MNPTRELFLALSLVALLLVATPAWSDSAADAAADADETEMVASDTDSLTFDQSRVFRLLGDAAAEFDRIVDLPERRWFGRDQDSVNRTIDSLIDNALKAMEVPEIITMRERYRELENRILSEQERRAGFRERRMFAPDTDASTLARFTPTETLRQMTASTRGDYDRLIEASDRNLQAYRSELESLKGRMADALASVGLSMPPDQLELWLSSAIGEDVISMGVVFQSIRTLTLRLEELTRESGESLPGPAGTTAWW